MLRRQVVARDEGVGSLGPLGNSPTIEPGDYKVTGEGVIFRNLALQPSGRFLNIGDLFTVDGEVKSSVPKEGTGAGTVVYFAHGVSPKLGEGYVAVQYLAPAEEFSYANYKPEPSPAPAPSPAPSPAPAPAPASSYAPPLVPVKTTITRTETSWFEDNWPYIFGAAAAVAVAYAVFGRKKRRMRLAEEAYEEEASRAYEEEEEDPRLRSYRRMRLARRFRMR
jgi:hypothetical protein